MKKIVLIVLTLILCLSMYACGQSSGDGSDTTVTDPPKSNADTQAGEGGQETSGSAETTQGQAAEMPVYPEETLVPLSTLAKDLLTYALPAEKEAQGGETVPPGTLPEVTELKRAQQTLVGTALRLDTRDREDVATAVYYPAEDGRSERIALIFQSEESGALGMLVILETDLGSSQSFAAQINGELSGKVLAVKLISYQEYVYARTVIGSSMKDICTEGAAPIAGEAVYAYLSADTVEVYSSSMATDSAAFEEDMLVLGRIYERFSVTELIGS